MSTMIATAAPRPPSVLPLSWLQTFRWPVHSINRLDHLKGTLWKMSSFSHQCHLQILHISLQDKISPSTATPSRLCSCGQSHHQNSSPLDWLPGCRHSMFKSTGPEASCFSYTTKQNQEICAVKSTSSVAILDTWTKDFCRATPGRGDVMTYRS